jgi:hypothetical protein
MVSYSVVLLSDFVVANKKTKKEKLNSQVNERNWVNPETSNGTF